MQLQLSCNFDIFLELYQQMLAKALADYFDAKLLLLDATDFFLKVSTYLERPFAGAIWLETIRL